MWSFLGRIRRVGKGLLHPIGTQAGVIDALGDDAQLDQLGKDLGAEFHLDSLGCQIIGSFEHFVEVDKIAAVALGLQTEGFFLSNG